MTNASTHLRHPADMAHDPSGFPPVPTDEELAAANAAADEGLAAIEARCQADRDEARFWRSNDHRWRVARLVEAGLAPIRCLTAARYRNVEATRRIARRDTSRMLSARRRPTTRCSRPFGARTRTTRSSATKPSASSSDPDPEPPRPPPRDAAIGGAA